MKKAKKQVSISLSLSLSGHYIKLHEPLITLRNMITLYLGVFTALIRRLGLVFRYHEVLNNSFIASDDDVTEQTHESVPPPLALSLSSASSSSTPTSTEGEGSENKTTQNAEKDEGILEQVDPALSDLSKDKEKEKDRESGNVSMKQTSDTDVSLKVNLKLLDQVYDIMLTEASIRNTLEGNIKALLADFRNQTINGNKSLWFQHSSMKPPIGTYPNNPNNPSNPIKKPFISIHES